MMMWEFSDSPCAFVTAVISISNPKEPAGERKEMHSRPARPANHLCFLQESLAATD